MGKFEQPRNPNRRPAGRPPARRGRTARRRGRRGGGSPWAGAIVVLALLVGAGIWLYGRRGAGEAAEAPAEPPVAAEPQPAPTAETEAVATPEENRSEAPAETAPAEPEIPAFQDVLASYDSPYPWNPSRTTNLTLACQAIDGTVLDPGEVFSFNGVVGERTAEKGYEAATVFVSGTSTPELGGGVCQVASTIYYCALKADLNILERQAHMFTVSYVPMGMDATIYWGSDVDLRFENSTGYPLRIDAAVSDDGYVHVSLVGTKTTDTTVEVDCRIVTTTEWEDVVEEDETQPADYEEVTQSPYTGYQTVTYKRYLDAAGNPVSDWEEVQRPYSNYQKRDRITTVGKQPDEEEVPEETPPEETDPDAQTDEQPEETPPEEGAAPAAGDAAPEEEPDSGAAGGETGAAETGGNGLEILE